MLRLKNLNHQLILEKVIQICKDPFVLFDKEGSIILVNDAFEKLYGWKANEVVGSRRLPFIHNILHYEKDILVQAIRKRKQLHDVEAKHITMKGYTITVQLNCDPVHYTSMDVGQLLIIRDITGKEAIHQAIENTSEAIFIHHKGRIVYLNKACSVLFMERKEDIIDKDFFSFIDEEDRPVMLDRVHKSYKGEELDTISIKINTKERIRKVNISELPVLYKGVHCTQIAMRDITEQEEYKEKLEKWAFHDALTGLPNRRYFIKKAEDILHEAKIKEIDCALIIIDCDNFKQINDTEGHTIGDQVLIHIGETLQKNVRNSDVITRIGGDEFIVLLNNLNHLEEGKEIALRILRALDDKWLIDQNWIKTTVSMGVVFNNESDSLNDLYHKADQALYRSKKRGTNSCSFY